ncbi:DUF6985 domain-containing protein [Undibacterium sp. Ji83W]|uniref:DUF6985 domain-containing protein n=1 Tax=Undibacterium sp. Ji83W TaxID=3413043 RepID=UPI003BF0B2A4
MQTFIKNISSDENFPLRGEVFLNLFDQYVDFLTKNQASIDYVERCAVYFNSLDATLIDALCEACIRSCNERAAMASAPAKTFATSRDVLKFISPSALIIPNIGTSDAP